LLFEYADHLLAQTTQDQVSEHLNTCSTCSADYDAILEMISHARVWHDLPAPAWQIPKIPSRVDFWRFSQWFPSLASTVALVLVGAIYLNNSASNAERTATPLSSPSFPNSVDLADPDRGNQMQTALESNRAQRQQELEALVRLLKGEMDRRSLETEESLRYVIAHQIQGQRELDDLYQRVQKISYPSPQQGQMQ
ncbi:MAG: zf-HC2 domain-containing protein, partial [Gammaproteobacteria bacterium]|nr:zf-HC2 domain-containing protein [Gammaproteobacteria bacterium]